MYLPLARKYRPQGFDEIVGQDHIATTLKNAITMGRVGYAYLFTGSRGVGKTSTARIFAKALNCQKGPTINPCGKCAPCQEIAKGISLDVLEIDGASNRGIDEIRNLRDNVKLKPSSGRYRIYIIDEVHMLTNEAFNALLKTLEEPPDHVKFIFATTRPQKILATILSRCQRFDFKIITPEELVKKLTAVSRDEKIAVDDDALFTIARAANGSLRDGEMLLDQAASHASGRITSADVCRMLGILEDEILTALSGALAEKNGPKVLDLIHDLMNNGRDPAGVATALLEHFHAILITAQGRDAARHLTLSEEQAKAFETLSRLFSTDEIFYILYTLSHALESITKTTLGRIPLEIALLKLSRKEKMLSLEEVSAWIKKIDKQDIISPGLQTGVRRGIDVQTVEQLLEEPQNPAASVGMERLVSGVASSGFERLAGIWPEVIRAVRAKKMSAGIYLEEGRLIEMKDTVVVIGFPRRSSLHKEALETKQNTDIILAVLKEFMEQDLAINFVLIDSPDEPADIPQEPVGVTAAIPTKKIEPIIRNALDKFNGKIVRKYIVKEED